LVHRRLAIAPLDGMNVYVKAENCWANYRLGDWEMGILRGSMIVIDGQQVVASRATAIASAAGGATVDTEARTAIDQILSALRHHGLIDA
jgi:hypothetical protein